MSSKTFRLLVLATLFASAIGCKTTGLSTIVAKDTKLVQVYDKCIFTEGPVADREGNVYFTDQPNNRILKYTIDGEVTVYMENCGRANGLYFDNNGDLLACADEKNQLWKIKRDKTVEVLINDFEGKKLNGPNDLWVNGNGVIYFTDPYYRRNYWINPGQEIKKQNLYCFNPTDNSLVVVDSNLVKPNGIIGNTKGNILYVADIGDSKTYVYTINSDGSLSNRKLFTTMGSDGMTIDETGNVYLTGKGVTIFNKQGVQIGTIPINKNWTSNVTFGGKGHKTLFITAMSSLYAIEMNVRGRLDNPSIE